MISVIAVDDEPVALDIIKSHAAKVPFLRLDATFISAVQALMYLKENPVDLVFLDISMPDLSGLRFAEITGNRVQIVFTTAHAEHALKGFELAATDYLLKPVNFERFFKSCELARTRQDQNKVSRTKRSIFVKDGHHWVQIGLDEILYVQAQDNYVNICEEGKATLTRMTLSELEQKLPAKEFVRVHKSYLVAISKITKIEIHRIVVNGIAIPLSKLYRDNLLMRCNG